MNRRQRRTHVRERQAADLILRDEQHRTANELSSALAALRLTSRQHGAGALPLVDCAIERLEGYVAVRRLLVAPEAQGCELVELLRELSIAMARGRLVAGGIRVVTSTLRVQVVPKLASAVLRLAHEMLTNALKHGTPSEEIVLSMRVSRRHLSLKCRNPCDGPQPTSTGRRGLRIMRALCEERDGRFRTSRSEEGYTAIATLPRLPRPDI